MLVKKFAIGFKPLEGTINLDRENHAIEFINISISLANNKNQNPADLCARDFENSEFGHFIMLDLNCITFEQEIEEKEMKAIFMNNIHKLAEEHNDPMLVTDDFEHELKQNWIKFKSNFEFETIPKISYKLAVLNGITYSFTTLNFDD